MTEAEDREPKDGLIAVSIGSRGDILLHATTVHPTEDVEIKVGICLLEHEADWLIQAIQDARSRISQ